MLNPIYKIIKKYNNIVLDDSQILITDNYNDYKFSLEINDLLIEIKLEKEKIKDQITIIKFLSSLSESNYLSSKFLPAKVVINDQFIYFTEIFCHPDLSILENKFQDGTITQNLNYKEFDEDIRKKVEVLMWGYKIYEDIKKYINKKYNNIYYHSIEFFLKKGDDYYSTFISFISEKEKKLNFLQEQLEKYIDTENYEKAHKIKIQIDRLKKL